MCRGVNGDNRHRALFFSFGVLVILLHFVVSVLSRRGGPLLTTIEERILNIITNTNDILTIPNSRHLIISPHTHTQHNFFFATTNRVLCFKTSANFSKYTEVVVEDETKDNPVENARELRENTRERVKYS